MTRLDVDPSEFNTYYKRYFDKITETTKLRKGFETGKKNVVDFFLLIPEEKLTYRYQPEKWTIKEVLQHLIDTERIFIYRCFRIARRDTTSLADFDQNIYIAPSGANDKSLTMLINEFTFNRNNSISLLQSLTNDDLKCIGTCNELNMSARAAAFTILGHDLWHMEVITTKYL
jgi:hypothetical protein